MVRIIVFIVSLVFLAGGGKPAPARELTDPMRPAAYRAPATAEQQKAETHAELRLTAILKGSQRRVAVINGEVLQVGQQIHGYRVTGIDARQVRLKKEGRQLVLSVEEQVMKRSSAAEQSP